MKKDRIMLGPRLSAVASFVRDGIVFYDIGSDHAYLPCSLLEQNKISYAYVCDIAKGPLSRAAVTVDASKVADRVKLCLSDGFKSVDIVSPCDIAIAGMGGEMIASIIDSAPELRNKDIRLILQPMTKPELLRGYLCQNGYSFEGETTVKEGKLYTVIVARYDGCVRTLTDIELLIGADGIRNENREFFELVEKKLDVLKSVSEGKRNGGVDCGSESVLISELEKVAERGK